jgi:hypothetical protein
MGISPLLKDEKIVPTNEARRMLAGINWAKTMKIPNVRKNQIPKSPIPRTPPMKAIPRENRETATIRFKHRTIKIFLIFLFILHHPIHQMVCL